mmetsp:Transcript_8290/g.14752  ORF Transcript_8290/g.14752 Transcript_8290/m.14752 type:complete len:214 (-) Transcript_8290:127-768(-)
MNTNKQLRPLEISRGNTNIVLFSRMVKLTKAPIHDSEISLLMINHNVLGLNVSMENAFGMSEFQSFQHLENVVLYIISSQFREQCSVIVVINIFENQGWNLGLVVLANIVELDDVRTPAKLLQNQYFALDLLLLHRLQNLHHCLPLMDGIKHFKHVRVLAFTKLTDDLIILWVAPKNGHSIVIPVIHRLVIASVGINLGNRSISSSIQSVEHS